eukprot:TRINITY_DN24502_c0_g1_i1.p1 TRINITY_DN24502_c0_g1~~TRINITY_DN24502_c0_g1_i1.p1  ORF type:complete len:387 (+),score=50.28 TRINITY_DN24502_c0_g1_i1:27-1187(+)
MVFHICEQMSVHAVTTSLEPFLGSLHTFQWDITSYKTFVTENKTESKMVSFPPLFAGHIAKPSLILVKEPFELVEIPPPPVDLRAPMMPVDFGRLQMGPVDFDVSLCFGNTTEIQVTVESVTISSGSRNVIKVWPQSPDTWVNPFKSMVIAQVRESSSDSALAKEILSTDSCCIKVAFRVIMMRRDSAQCVKAPSPNLSNDMETALRCDDLLELADVKLVASDGSEFPAHRLLLCIRSHVFRAAFRHDMQESCTGRFRINASPAAVKEFRQFVYTDQVNVGDDEDLMIELFELGKLYGLSQLEAQAEYHLGNALSVVNAAKIMIAFISHDCALRSSVVKFIQTHISEVMKSKEWMQIASNQIAMAALMRPSGADGHDLQKKRKRHR